MNEVLKILPLRLLDLLSSFKDNNSITEIRLRIGKNILVYMGMKEYSIEYIVTYEDLITILKNISLNSIYSVQKEINRGYITIEGGHRIGIAGEVVIEDNRIKNIKDISSMNIRIAKEFIGISNKVIDSIEYDGKVFNTIILSPPCSGKTTLLRDIIRNLSYKKYNVAVIDERGELACMSHGSTKLNIGPRTDVISYVDKAFGMQMAVRSLAPDVICTDEIGDELDVQAIKYLCRCGVSFITTMHGRTLEDLKNSEMREIIELGYVQNVIVLSNKGNMGEIINIYKNVKENVIC